MRRKFWLSSIQASLLFYGITIVLISASSGCDKPAAKSAGTDGGSPTKKSSMDKDDDEDDTDDKKAKSGKDKDKEKGESKSDKAKAKAATPKAAAPAAPGPAPKPVPAKPTAPPSNPLPAPGPGGTPGAGGPPQELVRLACQSKMTAPQIIALAMRPEPPPTMSAEQFAQIKASLEGVTEQQLADAMAQSCTPPPA